MHNTKENFNSGLWSFSLQASRGGQRVLGACTAAGGTCGGAELLVLPRSRAGGQSEESETEPEAGRRPDEIQGQTQRRSAGSTAAQGGH